MVVRWLIKSIPVSMLPALWSQVKTEIEFKMKATQYFILAGVLSGSLSLATACGHAQTAGQISAAKGILTKVPEAQVASKSAELVASAPDREKAAVAAAVGQVVAGMNADLAATAVAQICAKTPSVAPAAAAAAAAALPNSAAVIATAAANAPGVKVNDIRVAVIAAVPSKAVAIASALAQIKTGASLNQTSREGARLTKADSVSRSSKLEVF